MLSEYFTLSQGITESILVLRIHHKVDFADEIVWGQSWDSTQETNQDAIVHKIIDFLLYGMDGVKDWPVDSEGWHLPIKHFGMKEIISTTDLIPELWFINPEESGIQSKLKACLNNKREALNEKSILTETGKLYNLLLKLGLEPPKPRDFQSLVPVSFSCFFEKDSERLCQMLENYS